MADGYLVSYLHLGLSLEESQIQYVLFPGRKLLHGLGEGHRSHLASVLTSCHQDPVHDAHGIAVVIEDRFEKGHRILYGVQSKHDVLTLYLPVPLRSRRQWVLSADGG